MTQVAIRIPDADTTQIDALVASGDYKTRSAFVAHAIRQLLAVERARQIAEQYRRAYSEHPFPADDEAWVLDAGRRSLKRLEPYK